MNEHSSEPDYRASFVGRSLWCGDAPEGWCVDKGWSPEKREVMWQVWDEICYLDHRDTRPGYAHRLAYMWAMFHRGVRAMTVTLDHAKLLTESGFLVFPCMPNSKTPATRNGFKNASCDPAQVERWFGNGQRPSLAVACGAQPNGLNLLVIDVDCRDGKVGYESWAALLEEHTVPECPTAVTPSGGMHLVFSAPPGFRNSQSQLGPDLDVRAEGGYIMVAPSTLRDGSYAWVSGQELWTFPVPDAPAWMLELLSPREVAAAVSRHPSSGPSLGSLDGPWRPFEYVNGHLDFPDYLRKHGWQAMRGESWCRPDKDPRDGSSAELHADHVPPILVVFSTSIPATLEAMSLPVRGGGIRVTLADFICAYEFGGDELAFKRWAKDRYGPLAAPPRVATPGRAMPFAAAPEAADEPPSVGNGGGSLPPILPADFWTQRPALSHIRQAAQAAMCSPDALLVHALCRSATLIPPSWKLPGAQQGAIGKHATLDMIGCVVAETSGGKSLAAGVGEMLVPGFDDEDDLTVVPASYAQFGFDLPVGSGEGLVRFFMVPKWYVDENGDWIRSKSMVQGRTGLFLSVDEGTGFVNQADRKGATIVSTVASAFSGATLGQLNASDDTNRLLRSGRARICMVINMQDSNAHLLYTPLLESVGFTGRLLFASAHDPLAPPLDELPSWPGVLDWSPPAGSRLVDQYFSYDADISAEIRATFRGTLTGETRIAKRSSQHLVLRCKIAAVLAVWEGSTHISAAEWALAAQILDGSKTVLSRLESVQAQADQQRLFARGIELDTVNGAAETSRTRRLAMGWKVKVLTTLRADGPQSFKDLKRFVAAKYRTEFRASLDSMVAEGVLRVDGARYEIVPD